MTKEQVRAVLQRINTWPQERQEELVAIAFEIEADMQRREYHATPEELEALDQAEQSGLADDAEVAAAFQVFLD